MNAKMPKLLLIVLLTLVASLLVAGYSQKRSNPTEQLGHVPLFTHQLTAINTQGLDKG
ncbi:hypothetical protein [Paenibacillus taiwanensis]|uniref:hypothetical protein n=1 Tax=Paenibacillus taiwanensis TaxID=401638 RepID=UPI0004191AF2|nr:hypothetical protein [Paenibacillus taiwanensis]